jgi:hypothetical protein
MPLRMETSQLLSLGEGLELAGIDVGNDGLALHVIATAISSPCPLCSQLALRIHSHYTRET